MPRMNQDWFESMSNPRMRHCISCADFGCSINEDPCRECLNTDPRGRPLWREGKKRRARDRGSKGVLETKKALLLQSRKVESSSVTTKHKSKYKRGRKDGKEKYQGFGF